VTIAKAYRLSAEAIAPLATGRGGCIATDRIVVDGAPVGFMYRETPTNPMDSGWRFFAGDEDERYLETAANMAMYDVNTVTNYDPAIVAHLDAAVDSSFERVGTGFRLLDPDAA
jgi:hypothetical protein